MSRLATVDPQGRLDVLAYRLAERGAQRLMPREWPAFAPHVEKWAEKRFGPKALGELSWQSILLASNPATLPWASDTFQTGWINPFLQVIGLEDTPSLPKSSSPVSQGPAAPLTAEKMTSWSTADLAETEAQKGRQYQMDTVWFNANSTGNASQASSKSGSGIPPLDVDDNTKFLLIAIAAAAVGVILLVRR